MSVPFRLFNFAAFYVGWIACVAGAGRGMTTLGPAVVAVLLATHLGLTRQPAREGLLILTVGVLGWGIDTTQAVLGVFSFGRRSFAPWLCPLWLVAVWLIFASTLTVSLRWLAGRYVLAALFGAVGGPLSYYYGARLGAVDLQANPLLSLVPLALVWGLTMPVLVWIAKAVVPVRLPAAPGAIVAAMH